MTELVILPDSTSVSTDVGPVRFHLSLNVSNLAAAIDFYRVLFNRPPAKQHDDYAKFDLDHPPVVFSLVPRSPGQGGSLSHLGLRVADPAILDVYWSRLEAAGICTSNQEGTVCGYARQDKLWLRDPDGNFWEIYHIEEDIPPDSVRQSLSGTEARIPEPEFPKVWEHYITGPFPERIPCEDQTLDEVLLTGTFNADISDELLAGILRESFRVLKPHGKVTTHGLMGTKTVQNKTPGLPGLAALVQRIPGHQDVLERLKTAGFAKLEIVKFTDKAWFEFDGVPLREVKIAGYRPLIESEITTRTALYRGPFARLVTDDGNCFARGKRISVSDTAWKMLRQGSSADSFVFFETGTNSSCSSK